MWSFKDLSQAAEDQGERRNFAKSEDNEACARFLKQMEAAMATHKVLQQLMGRL